MTLVICNDAFDHEKCNHCYHAIPHNIECCKDTTCHDHVSCIEISDSHYDQRLDLNNPIALNIFANASEIHDDQLKNYVRMQVIKEFTDAFWGDPIPDNKIDFVEHVAKIIRNMRGDSK